MPEKESKRWKRGRGKLGLLDPLLGVWSATADSPMGPVACRRSFARAIGGAWIVLEAEWDFSGKRYLEHAIYGVGESGELTFWSFTSDGKRSVGRLADGQDVHPSAIAFEAEMPAGLARMVYWPADDDGLRWAVESRTQKGWRRFTEHHYRRA
ncbi:MAG: hypothetical protein IPJ17_17490 [Holophagales bacterium]|nr:MAG: hypothetical protein IPJ17_17490 [Holophagales bacterium]